MERKPLLVKDFMAGNLVTFSPNQNVHDAVKLFVEKNISGGTGMMKSHGIRKVLRKLHS